MMELKSVLILTITIAFAVADISVTIPNGTLRGRKAYSLRGISFYAFQQIPYAKPPVGELRFREPQPADNWEGILDATRNDKACFQFNHFFKNISDYENEDCLYLNVYTPKYPSVDLALPVMFQVYGGSFIDGSANFEYVGPHYLMEHGGVIVVTANYRGGALGFLSTGDEVIPGNYGLKDLHLVLKWIQENIKYFGGDPKKVTLSSSSAGAAAAGYLMMGKGSEDLFRAAILLSGSNIEPLAYQRSHRSIAFKLGAALGRNFTESKELLQFLRTIPPRNLSKAASQLTVDNVYLDQYMDGFIFSPVIEPEHETALVTERSYGVLESGRMARVPLLIGTVSEEMLIKPKEDTFSSELAAMDNDTSLLVCRNMHITDKNKLRKIGKIIRSWYTNGTLQDDMGAGVRFLSEASFTRPLIRHAQLQSRFSDVYFYEFSYSGKLGQNMNDGPFFPGIQKVQHAEDMLYIFAFYNNSGLNDYPKEDILTSDRYRALLTNFVVHLNPTPEPSSLLQNISWPKVTPDNFQYLSINETLSIRKNYREDTYRKWLRLYEAFAVKPYDTF